MPGKPSATLIAEVGTAITKLTLVDLVDDEYRLIARAETWSTFVPPESDLTLGVLRLAETLESITGRELVRNGQLLAGPGQPGGVGGIVITTSAGGAMRVVVMALAAQQSAREAANAARGTYTRIEHVFALDDAGEADPEWFGREVNRLSMAQPEVIVVAGGLEGGAVAPVERIGHIVGLLVHRSATPPLVIYGGNSTAASAISAAVGARAEVRVVDNLRPAVGVNRLEPVRAILREVYDARRLPAVRGYERAKAWRLSHYGTVAAHEALIVRFLAERFGRNILALDVGATHSIGLIQADGHFSEAVMADRGLIAGALALVESDGGAAVTRWLPFELSEADLRNRLLNRLLRPNILPSDLDALLIDYAILREIVRSVVDVLSRARPALHYDLVIAGGVVARAPRQGLAALVLLDSLPLERNSTRFAVDLYLDGLSLLPVAGALAYVDADAAACLMERDGLNNGPLATVVVPRGSIEIGAPVMEVELTTSRDDVKKVVVEGGQIARLALGRGQRGTLRIRPSQGIYIGDNAPGAEVLSDEAAIAGSALGILIDARPRPLALPEQVEERKQQLLAWLRALDALPPSRGADVPVPSAPETPPIGEQDTVPAEPAEAVVASNGGTEAVPAADQTASEGPRPDDEDEQAGDIRAMRASLVEQPKPKRGFFRRV